MIFSQPNACPLIAPFLFFVMVFEPSLHLLFTICIMNINLIRYAKAKSKSGHTIQKHTPKNKTSPSVFKSSKRLKILSHFLSYPSSSHRKSTHPSGCTNFCKAVPNRTKQKIRQNFLYAPCRLCPRPSKQE